ncbi:helix-turn-helix domain-containing protein [Roseomonas mucosa]|uniref:helix-turn-helix domain-containing protein n=1 Tax=Roseomonas mucosa TaxID=207340 RepID=UPI002247CB27|nr:helix-turn-helix transcriptional regulator [Roseomonas mucosa]
MTSATNHKHEVGARLRLAMEAQGLSQSDLSRVLHVSLSKIGNWLRGDNYPDAYLMTVFCDRYGVTMDWLYRGKIAGLPSEMADGLARGRAASEAPASVEARRVPAKRRAADQRSR